MSVGVEERGWLRRNRWWLLALPVALALALASAAYRVNDFWFENGWHRVDATVEQGQFVTTRATVYSFDEKPTPADLRVRLGSVSSSAMLQDSLGSELPMPAGAVAVQVRLDFRAVKGKPAPYCTVFVVDDEGNRYAVTAIDGGTNPCPPPGFSYGDTTAPERWSRTVSAAVPKDVTVREVRLGITWPDYVRMTLTNPQRAADLPAGARSEQSMGANR